MRPVARFVPDSLIGRELPGTSASYRLVHYISSGGIAHIYLAQSQGQQLVIKLLRPELAANVEVVERFQREARLARRVHSEGVVRVVEEVMEYASYVFFVSEHLTGVDVADLLGARKRIAPARALRISLGAALGLAAAHQVGIVHRDVKPENLFLVHLPDGRELVKVLDFGMALDLGSTSRTEGGFVGTPGYASPEQSHGAVPHPTADVYSLGVVLYEMLAGAPPFSARSWVDLLSLHALSPPPTIPGLPASLEEVLQKALMKRPSERFASMEAFIAAKKEVLAGLSAPRTG
jgi:serine/threonine-protein kinase